MTDERRGISLYHVEQRHVGVEFIQLKEKCFISRARQAYSVERPNTFVYDSENQLQPFPVQ